jgi:uncharacterized protein YdhG (YjbR/CyaY superfamily)
MRSDAGNVDDYLAELPDDRRRCLETIRAACRELLTGFEESMAYGMPSYSRDGGIEVAYASQKGYLAVYILRTDVLNAHRDQLAGFDVGKGCIRYRSSGQIDSSVLRSMLSATAATTGPVC